MKIRGRRVKAEVGREKAEAKRQKLVQIVINRINEES